jgi:hypothetical protein
MIEYLIQDGQYPYWWLSESSFRCKSNVLIQLQLMTRVKSVIPRIPKARQRQRIRSAAKIASNLPETARTIFIFVRTTRGT